MTDPVVSIKPMRLSDGSTDYFVELRVGERHFTPYVFKEEFKAAYHVALFQWLFGAGAQEEPDLMAYTPEGWPGKEAA